MTVKKVAILGRGTAGAIVANKLLGFSCEIEWYYTSDKKPQPVGEGTTSSFPEHLEHTYGMTFSEMEEAFDATVKLGIHYERWNNVDRFTHGFHAAVHGMHFNAGKFQDYAFNSALNLPNVTAIDKAVTEDEIDCDYVFDCSGRPVSYEGYRTPKYIPVNSAFVTQCFWDTPQFYYTKTVAMKWGWVFMVPLQNRCSVGYLFNRDICSLDTVQEDVQRVFAWYGLNPSDVTNHIAFNNYVKEQIITKRTAYLGNSGFFLEPMEATTIDSILQGANKGIQAMRAPQDASRMNREMQNFFVDVEQFIMLHYAAGGSEDSPFWDYAKERGDACLKDTEGKHPLNQDSKTYFCQKSYQQNIKGLRLDIPTEYFHVC